MTQFLYVAWFRGLDFDPSDPNYEWPACILVEAASAEAARAWGDVLAQDRAGRYPGEPFLYSYIDESWSEGGDDAAITIVPRVSDGEMASDDKIGW